MRMFIGSRKPYAQKVMKLLQNWSATPMLGTSPAPDAEMKSLQAIVDSCRTEEIVDPTKSDDTDAKIDDNHAAEIAKLMSIVAEASSEAPQSSKPAHKSVCVGFQ